MNIMELSVYPVNRQQFCGYEHTPVLLNDGTSLGFVELPQNPEPTKELAWLSFGGLLNSWLTENLGVILWLDKPVAIKNLKGWTIHCRLAVTEDVRFKDADQIAPRPPHEAKFPMMTPDEMLGG